jgi:hypothetical protein
MPRYQRFSCHIRGTYKLVRNTNKYNTGIQNNV